MATMRALGGMPGDDPFAGLGDKGSDSERLDQCEKSLKDLEARVSALEQDEKGEGDGESSGIDDSVTANMVKSRTSGY